MIDYSLYGLRHEDAQLYREKLSAILGDSIFHLLMDQRAINKDNILKHLINEIERQPDEMQKYYRAALETIGVHAR
ncbi:biofilm development regulator YmgB/AriR family protein [Serratia sp. AKBS12]|uniref:biofilm development regulator YmgB/AriR family protein n=1 Tax=Serratia sp. AKBS12 TaxID=2974597 RepID=UPI002165AA88|nr:biofilm development regulator YmgB/AriR family protein [Serratia sp. AKBS12]MCS3409092.1 biofilm development regulator YmgB/AriR family protein [Serratia sp. AKBS12]HEI8865419.1 hypothetical protein [Serratia odorifera]